MPVEAFCSRLSPFISAKRDNPPPNPPLSLAHLEDRSFTIATLESAVERNQMFLLLLILIKLARKLCGFLEAEKGGCGWGRMGQVWGGGGCHNGIDYANVFICRNANVLKEII